MLNIVVSTLLSRAWPFVKDEDEWIRINEISQENRVLQPDNRWAYNYVLSPLIYSFFVTRHGFHNPNQHSPSVSCLHLDLHWDMSVHAYGWCHSEETNSPVSTFTARFHVLCILSLAYGYSMAISRVALTRKRWFNIWTPLSRHMRFPPKSDQRWHKHVSQCGFLADQFHKLYLHLHLRLRWPY